MIPAGRPVEIFVDFDGTITSVDTFDVLVARAASGSALWDTLDSGLADGSLTLRDVLRREAASVRVDRALGERLWDEVAQVDPTFVPFVHEQRAQGATVSVVSAGIGSLIRRALSREGIDDLPIIANDVDYDPRGWTMQFFDDSEHGIAKERFVREARERGAFTVYIGDGVSDLLGASEADLRFAKRGLVLARYLEREGLSYSTFERFAEINAALRALRRTSA